MIGRLYRAHPRRSVMVDRALPQWLRQWLHQAMVTNEQLQGLAVWMAAGPLVGLIGWQVIGPSLAWSIACLVIAVPVVVLITWSGRRQQAVIVQLPEVVEATSRSLRSGVSFSRALAETVEHGPPVVTAELVPVLAAIRVGQSHDDALQQWVDRMPYPEVEMVAAALAIAHRFEAGATQALDSVAQSLRDRAALASEVRSLTGQASASLRALVLLPAGFLLLDVVTGQTTLEYLVSQRLGRACLVAGVVLNLLGWWWMTSLIGRRVST